MVEVQSFDGLYDEQCEAILHNIAKSESPAESLGWFERIRRAWRPPSFHQHTFVNGSLRFEKNGFSINLQSDETQWAPAWGGGYGGIRYCAACKFIDCIHLFGEPTLYRLPLSDFHYARLEVGTCKICKRRINRGACTVNNPTLESRELIARVATELGKPIPSGPGSPYGSGWYIELPVQVSQILSRGDVRQAESFVRSCFIAGRVNI